MTLKTPKIELVDTASLKPYDKNAKKHSPEQIKRLATQIERHGFDQPIVAWRNPDKELVIIKGHGRQQALLLLGQKKAPVIIRDDLTAEQADAMRIADNALSSVEYDTKLIAEETKRLLDFDFDAMDFGFSPKDEKMFIENLDDTSLDVLTDDVSLEIGEQKKEDVKRASEIDDENVKLTEVFSAKTVTTRQARILNRFMAVVEDETGKEGIEALIAYAESHA